ncbi:uncharacterized protein SPPG_00046 [Spizellomyces punctatus DAOM BR117]|uniref:Uncharacterized protein n=1 Tax=Spizellomyces punctatus (strain DAOM BR117) TaxID=645134 RepID=A0A0L0HTT7_SPIPD|nr:uncharacterized protein SPPG_00046 [Spizellomyces punctatus DAOM BR117]KND04315.1 hypothetical protein SPPG_00046 [Spizellomyces punctatus DAOM BR117]|eukprot:XP_016612354.1 hypothetical protein SPPG_00046 [Spizellomyces punctatus DAOM BR117]
MSSVRTISRSLRLRPVLRAPQPRLTLQQRCYASGAKAAKPGASSKLLWTGIAAAVLGGGYYYIQQTPGKKKLDQAVDSAKSGDVRQAAAQATQAVSDSYPELTKTLSSLLGKEFGDAVTKALDAANKARDAASKGLDTETGRKLQERAKEIEEGARAVLRDAMELRKQAVKELGPAAKKHYEAVKDSISATKGSSWDTVETGLKALRKEGSELLEEAKQSHVGEELKKRIKDLVAKADDLRKQAEAYLHDKRK